MSKHGSNKSFAALANLSFILIYRFLCINKKKKVPGGVPFSFRRPEEDRLGVQLHSGGLGGLKQLAGIILGEAVQKYAPGL
ncbi:hypothetical protein CLV24_114123 [Pontibacter ummariensis]|uniref:Uncharacterized protein n=1 Tax=Pontibacter ummariensis TaxID=1610492 RepID=A0A239HRG8_9BACT|nr:hypothetical protein CLV24_114123 [Pontibacter ummariensis]SNS83791.1 hypothetical protein SAMN06296052_114123 [Pontibacter ummariensis]